MIAFLEVAIGVGTGPMCARCAASTPSVPQPVALDALCGVLEDAAISWDAGPGPNVAFVGLEPFAHPELPGILSVARASGFERIRLRTDAGALAHTPNAEGAVRSGVNHLEVVLLADGPDHDRLTRRPGLFTSAVAGVEAYHAAAQASGVRVAVAGRVFLCRHNAALAPGAVARLAALGVVGVGIDATGCREADLPMVAAALDTAAVNAVAGWVEGLADSVMSVSDAAPWRVVGGQAR